MTTSTAALWAELAQITLPCKDCEGTGFVAPSLPIEPATGKGAVACPTCHGEGSTKPLMQDCQGRIPGTVFYAPLICKAGRLRLDMLERPPDDQGECPYCHGTGLVPRQFDFFLLRWVLRQRGAELSVYHSLPNDRGGWYIFGHTGRTISIPTNDTPEADAQAMLRTVLAWKRAQEEGFASNVPVVLEGGRLY